MSQFGKHHSTDYFAIAFEPKSDNLESREAEWLTQIISQNTFNKKKHTFAFQKTLLQQLKQKSIDKNIFSRTL